jgi:hypothetical protein
MGKLYYISPAFSNQNFASAQKKASFVMKVAGRKMFPIFCDCLLQKTQDIV